MMEPGPGFEPGTWGLRVPRPAELGYPGTVLRNRPGIYKLFSGLAEDAPDYHQPLLGVEGNEEGKRGK